MSPVRRIPREPEHAVIFIGAGIGDVINGVMPDVLIGCDVKFDDGHWVAISEGLETRGSVDDSRAEVVLAHFKARLVPEED